MKPSKAIALACRIVGLSALILLALLKISQYQAKNYTHNYIAHGGGAIDGNIATNSLQSVENALRNGIKYIELDLHLTADSQIVATHDWLKFSSLTGWPQGTIPTLQQFQNQKILGRYTPLTAQLIDSIFSANTQAVLVTDKITDIDALDKSFHNFKDRILVECFTPRQYNQCLEKRFTPLRSYHNLVPGGTNVVKLNSLRQQYLQFIPTRLAVYSFQSISKTTADSLFRSNPRIAYVYIDEI